MKNKSFLFIASSLIVLFSVQIVISKRRPMRRPNRGKIIKAMDTNKDGKISKKEWNSFHENLFKKQDKNSNGYLEKDELRPQRRKEKPLEKESDAFFE